MRTRLAISLLLLALCAPVAQASFPGRNGDFVVAVEGCGQENHYLAKTPWTGGPLTALTAPCQYATSEGETSLDVYSPDAAPDGQSVLALQVEYPYHPESGPRPLSFTQVPADGGERSRIPLPSQIQYVEHPPSFAPDGQRFAFWGSTVSFERPETDIFAMRLDGSGTREISGRDAFTQPRWSPDGKLVAVVVSQYSNSSIKPGIWLVRARDGRRVRRVAKHGGWVDWSPDGRHLVYATTFTRAGTRAAGGNLYVVSRQGGKARRLVSRDAIAETDPAWSPDGRWIAFVSLRFEGGGDVSWRIHASLWRVRARGGRPQRIESLPGPSVDEGYYDPPELTWLPLP
jgi:Tol biopolymer transport system component